MPFLQSLRSQGLAELYPEATSSTLQPGHQPSYSLWHSQPHAQLHADETGERVTPSKDSGFAALDAYKEGRLMSEARWQRCALHSSPLVVGTCSWRYGLGDYRGAVVCCTADLCWKATHNPTWSLYGPNRLLGSPTSLKTAVSPQWRRMGHNTFVGASIRVERNLASHQRGRCSSQTLEPNEVGNL
jgi:hypothetical protein